MDAEDFAVFVVVGFGAYVYVCGGLHTIAYGKVYRCGGEYCSGGEIVLHDPAIATAVEVDLPPGVAACLLGAADNGAGGAGCLGAEQGAVGASSLSDVEVGGCGDAGADSETTCCGYEGSNEEKERCSECEFFHMACVTIVRIA